MASFYVLVQFLTRDAEGNPERDTAVHSFHDSKNGAFKTADKINIEQKRNKEIRDFPSDWFAIVFPYVTGTRIFKNAGYPVWNYPEDLREFLPIISPDVLYIISEYSPFPTKPIQCQKCNWYATPAKIQCYRCHALICKNCTTLQKQNLHGEYHSVPAVNPETHLCSTCTDSKTIKDSKMIEDIKKGKKLVALDDSWDYGYVPIRWNDTWCTYFPRFYDILDAGDGYETRTSIDDGMIGTRRAPRPYLPLSNDAW